MGQSMTGITAAELTPALLEEMHLPVTYDAAKLDGHFSVYAQEGKLYRSEFETDAAGKNAFWDTRQLKWKIGVGENGFGLLTERDGYLFQARLSFYSSPQAWGPPHGHTEHRIPRLGHKCRLV